MKLLSLLIIHVLNNKIITKYWTIKTTVPVNYIYTVINKCSQFMKQSTKVIFYDIPGRILNYIYSLLILWVKQTDRTPYITSWFLDEIKNNKMLLIPLPHISTVISFVALVFSIYHQPKYIYETPYEFFLYFRLVWR